MLGHRPLVIEDYFAILKRRGWMIIIPALLLPIIAVAITYRITPIYMSQTLVLIEPQTVPDTYVKPIIAEDLDSRLASMKEQILSRSRLEPIIERFNLGTPGMNMDDKIVQTRKNIGIVPIHSEIQGAGGLPGFFISFTAPDPHTAQLVCREITSLFVSENLQAREQSAEGTTAFLKGQLEQAKANLDQQDQKLAEFQKQYMGTLPEQQGPNMEMLNTLGTQLDATTQSLTRLENEETLVESMLAQESRQTPAAPGMRSTPQADTLELQRLQDKEADLKTRYTPDYPDVVAVQRQIDDLKKQMAAAPAASSTATPAATRYDSPGTMQLRAQVAAMTQAIAQKKQQQGELQAQIRQYQGKIQSTPLVEAKMKDLTRDHDQAQEFYNSLLGKMNNSQMATDLERRQEGENFKIMDDANLPDAPTFPNRSMFAIGGLVLGLGFGVLLIAFLEYRDKSLRTERDVWAFTKLPTLATIALIHDAKGNAKGSIGGLFKKKDVDSSTNKSLANVGS
jgi:polysaccharide chain length determinant protein (PEP-CTERM system associated)